MAIKELRQVLFAVGAESWLMFGKFHKFSKL